MLVERYYVKYGRNRGYELMSNIGKKSIDIPDGVDINLNKNFWLILKEDMKN